MYLVAGVVLTFTHFHRVPPTDTLWEGQKIIPPSLKCIMNSGFTNLSFLDLPQKYFLST